MKLQDIKLNEKYTILSNSNDIFSSAFCKVLKGTIVDIQIVQYAQYNNAIQIKFKPYRCKKNTILTILKYDDIIIMKGYHDIKSNHKENDILIPTDTTKYCNHSNTVYYKRVGESIEPNINYESIPDITFNYLAEQRFSKGLRGEDAKDENYYIMLKNFLFNLNYSINNEMIEYFKNNDYEYLIQDVKKVRFTLFDIN